MAPSTKQIVILSCLYLFSRIIFLTHYPIFNDEATYLRYGQVMTTVSTEHWYSLAHTGKQPLLYWLYGFSMQLFADPLAAGRLVTVIIGLTTVWALYLLAGWVASLLYIVAPLFIFFDRLALVDNALAALFSWLLVAIRYKKPLLAGVLVGVSFWIKSTAIIFLAIGLWSFPSVVFLSTVTFIAGPLFLRPEAARIFEMAHEYTYSLRELVAIHFSNISGNLLNTLLVYVGYISPIALVAALMKKNRYFFMWLFTLAMVIVFGKSVHGRYLVFTAIPMILLAAPVLRKNKILLSATVFIMVFLSTILILDAKRFFHLFPHVGVYKTESFQYKDGWPAGYGISDMLRFIDEDRHDKPAMIAVRWDTGNPEDAMFVYGKGDLEIKYLDMRLPQEVGEVFLAARTKPVYFVTRKGQYGGFEKYLHPLGKFSNFELFRVTPL